MRKRFFALLFVTLLAPTVIADDDEKKQPESPMDLPAFRSVLDGRPRILTVPITKQGTRVNFAYDATDCGLYKAWSGDVDFDGAVYTTVHGPQPTARGLAYVLDESVAKWWIDDRPAKTRFQGYRIEPRGVIVRFEVEGGRKRFQIEEQPSFLGSDETTAVIRREIHVEPSPVEGDLFVTFQTRGMKTCNAEGAEIEVIDDFVFHGDPLPTHRVRVPVRASTSIETHHDEAVLSKYAIWKLEQAIVKEAEATEDEPKEVVPEHPTDTPVGSGVSVRIYSIGQSMAQLRTLVEGQTPNVSHVLPVLDLRSERGDFGGVEDEFITHVDGFIDIETAGEYVFQLESDDGSRLYIDDEVVVDHDGLHGVTAMEGEATLEAGRHKLFVEHFENGGGEQLTLSWKKPGDTEFEIVPNAVLKAPKGEVRVTSPGKKKIVGIVPRGRAGDGRPLDAVHPAFDLMTVRPEDFHPRVGGMDWHPDGPLLICCWEPMGGVYLVEGATGDDRSTIRVKRIAAGLAEPLGLKVVGDRIFVLQKQELTELIDHDGDDVIDEYRCVANGWGVTPNFHEFAFGLVYKDDHFYATLATAINPGGASTQPQNPDRGKVVKIAMDGSYEFVAEGLRTPNGIGIGVDGEIFVTDNQGDWLPVSKVVHVTPGAFFGSHSVEPDAMEGKVEKPPVVWLPQGEIGNSPGEPGVMVEGPYRGQMLHSEITHGGLKRVFVEKVKGQYQGCVFRFTQGLEAGINRWTRGPKGRIYVGGIGSSGNWGQTGKLRYGLQRLAWNGKVPFEMLAVRARPNGFRIEFTKPINEAAGDDPDDYLLQRWRYVPTENYGGPKVDLETIPVTAVRVAKDRRSVDIQPPKFNKGWVYYLQLARSVRDAEGNPPWSSEAWYTLNSVPTPEGDVVLMPPKPLPNQLTPAEREAGWELLFDGRSAEHWRAFKKKHLPSAWQIQDGALVFTNEGEGGDIVTKEQYTHFELSLEWRVQERGNSGVFFHVTEDQGSVWATGPEMQILDNEGHPDGSSDMTSAGANYAMHAPCFDVTRPPGHWNHARLVVKRGYVQHWLNGYKLLAYELGSDDWQARYGRSKFKAMDLEGYGRKGYGHIALQDHGDVVAFRNIKIRPVK